MLWALLTILQLIAVWAIANMENKMYATMLSQYLKKLATVDLVLFFTKSSAVPALLDEDFCSQHGHVRLADFLYTHDEEAA